MCEKTQISKLKLGAIKCTCYYDSKSLDNKASEVVVFMDLPKAFDTINHDLHITKFHAFGFDKINLKLLLVTWIIDDIGQKLNKI